LTSPVPVLELSAVGKTFDQDGRKVTVLRDIDLVLSSRECAVVIGPSGSGKSTLLSICGLLLDPTVGHRFMLGEDVTRVAEDRAADLRFSSIGHCFQSFLLVPSLTAAENVMLPGVPRQLDFDPHERADSLLVDVGLAEHRNDLASSLSGGEQQRVALARALFANPALLLIDEPTANLDRTTARSIVSLLESKVRRGPTAVLIATHDPLVADLADKRLELNGSGRL
jgi:putative ABC transport system ATP-binding protein